MKRCPECEGTRHYKLSDGRLKCRRCRKRFHWRSAWEVSRLSEAVKKHLLEWFVLGVPVHRQRFMSIASAPATERFYRLIRACMAHNEQVVEPLFEESDETTVGEARSGKRSSDADGRIIVFRIIIHNDQVKAISISANSRDEMLEKIQAYTHEDSLYYTNDCPTYAALRISGLHVQRLSRMPCKFGHDALRARGAHVVTHKEKDKSPDTDHIDEIESFWSYAKNWLHPHRDTPCKYFHLYIGEVCYRFNHRNENINPLLIKLLKTTSNTDIAHDLVQIG